MSWLKSAPAGGADTDDGGTEAGGIETTATQPGVQPGVPDTFNRVLNGRKKALYAAYGGQWPQPKEGFAVHELLFKK